MSCCISRQDGIAPAPLGRRYRTAHDVDFTAQANQDFVAGGDGSYVINGLTYNVTNTANATDFEIINGTGLRILINGNVSDYVNAVRTAPIIALPYTQLAGLSPWCPVRVFWVFSFANFNQAFETVRFGFEIDTAAPEAPAAFEHAELGVQNDGAGNDQIIVNTTNAGVTASDTFVSNIGAQDVCMGQALDESHFLFGLGTGDPALIDPEANVQAIGRALIANLNDDTQIFRRDNARIFMMAGDGNGGGNAQLTITRMIVQTLAA